jgi:hypothetical protein
MSLELEREHAVQVLCRLYAQDHLTTEELESRLEAAYRATSLAELQALTPGLPADVNAGSQPAHAVYQPSHDAVVRAESRILCVFAQKRKRGEWEPGTHTSVDAVFGSVELDLREARIAPGLTTLEINAVFAEVTVIVPPGLQVECDGNAIMGEFADKVFEGASGPGTASVRIGGTAVFSSVNVKMRFPDETPLEALKRERLAKKSAKR